MEFNYRQKIKDELEARQARNRFYSLRAFSRDLGISVTALHSAVHFRRHLSKKNLNKVSEALGWDLRPATPKLQLITQQPETQRYEHQWYHDAILNLASRGECFADTRWLASRLGLEPEVAGRALNMLSAFGHIEVEDGRIRLGRKDRELPEAAQG